MHYTRAAKNLAIADCNYKCQLFYKFIAHYEHKNKIILKINHG